MSASFLTTPALDPAHEPKAQRLAREAAVVAKGWAELQSGVGIDQVELETWLDQLDQNPDAPPPISAVSATGAYSASEYFEQLLTYSASSVQFTG